MKLLFRGVSREEQIDGLALVDERLAVGSVADDEVLVKLHRRLERRLLPDIQEIKMLDTALVSHDTIPSVLGVLAIFGEKGSQVDISDGEGA